METKPTVVTRTKKSTIHPKILSVLRAFEFFVMYHGITGKKPNRSFRRAALLGVKVGKNAKMTKSRKADGSLRRSRMTLV